MNAAIPLVRDSSDCDHREPIVKVQLKVDASNQPYTTLSHWAGTASSASHHQNPIEWRPVKKDGPTSR